MLPSACKFCKQYSACIQLSKSETSMDPQSWSDSDTSGDGNSTELSLRTKLNQCQQHRSNCLPKILSCTSFWAKLHVILLVELLAIEDEVFQYWGYRIFPTYRVFHSVICSYCSKDWLDSNQPILAPSTASSVCNAWGLIVLLSSYTKQCSKAL